MPGYQVFIDLTKAFVTVNRERHCGSFCINSVIQHILYVFLKNYIETEKHGQYLMVSYFVDFQQTTVSNKEIFLRLHVSIFILLLCFDMLLTIITAELKPYFRHLATYKAKTFKTFVRDLLNVDDVYLLANSGEDMQYIMDRFSTACVHFRLTISLREKERNVYFHVRTTYL